MIFLFLLYILNNYGFALVCIERVSDSGPGIKARVRKEKRERQRERQRDKRCETGDGRETEREMGDEREKRKERKRRSSCVRRNDNNTKHYRHRYTRCAIVVIQLITGSIEEESRSGILKSS